MLVVKYTDDEISFIASEPDEGLQKRMELEDRIKMLEEGQMAFKKVEGQVR